MKKIAHVWVIETRTPGIRKGVWTDWAPWIMRRDKAHIDAEFARIKEGHAECCNPPRLHFRIRKYTRDEGGRK